MADSREEERRRKLAKKPSLEEAKQKIEQARKRAVAEDKRKKAESGKKRERTKRERNPFNVRSADQAIRDRRFRNQTTDSNNP